MSHEKLLEVVEQRLFDRQLNSCERYILEKSWEGEKYSKIARESGYAQNYIKHVGAKLWSDISLAMGKTVTKKNLHIVFDRKKIIAPKPEPDKQPELSWSDASPPKISFPSAPLSSNSTLYINRPPIEDIAYTEIEYPGCLLRINGARKIGKSSLLNQILAHASAKNFASVTIDLQEAESDLFSDLNNFLQWFCALISHQLDFPTKLEEYWQINIGSKVSCKAYLEYLLNQLNRPLVLAINELNRLFEYSNLTRDFLSMLRFWHEQSKSDRLWQNLRLILVHSTDIHVPLGLTRSPFHAGVSLRPPLFSFKQTAVLAQRYGLNFEQSKEYDSLVQLYEMVNGHPYLTSLAFYYLQKKIISFPELIKTAPTSKGIFHNYLLGLLITLQLDPHLITVFKDAITLESGIVLDAIAAHQLNSLGLVEYDEGLVKPICQLYRLYFQKQLS